MERTAPSRPRAIPPGRKPLPRIESPPLVPVLVPQFSEDGYFFGYADPTWVPIGRVAAQIVARLERGRR